MIAYFDTSAIVALLVEELAPPVRQVWENADRLVSVALVRVEPSAALARHTDSGESPLRLLETAKQGSTPS